MLELNVQLKMQ